MAQSNAHSGSSVCSESVFPRSVVPPIILFIIVASCTAKAVFRICNMYITPIFPTRNASALCHPSLRVDNGESLSVSNSNVHFTRVKGLHDDQRFSFYPSNYSFVNQVVQNRLVSSTTSHHGTLKLVNLGNTCFMNAGLQCLLHCTPLTDYFLGIYWEDEVNLDNALGHKGVMVKAYVKLLETLWTSNSSSIHNPSDFKHTVGRIMPMFSGNKQHEVQEFVAFMLDAIHEDLNRVRGIKPYVRDLEWIEEEDQEITARKAWKGYLHRNRSIIVDLFQGQLRSQLRCLRCGYMSVKFDPFMYLSVPIPKQSMKRIITLQQCLEYFCEEEALDVKEQWFCRMCRDFVPSAKKLDLWKLPPVLIVHLKRFAYDGKRNRCRNNAKVSFPVTSLDLSNFVKSYQREPPDYDLFAVANHHGGRMSSGHYTAQALDRVMGEWNKFNDAHVDPVSHSAVCSPSEKAYVLFYSKMRPGMETKSNSHPKVSKRGRFGNNHYFHRRIGIIRRQSLSKPQNWPHAKSGNQVPTPDKQQ